MLFVERGKLKFGYHLNQIDSFDGKNFGKLGYKD